MMIVSCPSCNHKLRLDPVRYAGKRLSLTCRGCQHKFPCAVPAPEKILVAHGEPEVCRDILRACRQDVGEILTCSDARMARDLLGRHDFSVMLLDVALPGAYPFELIEEVRRTGNSLKIVLLPSVYNRTAYKRRPTSLYGADAYLELHHLGDRLVSLLRELVPEISLKSRPGSEKSEEGAERALPESSDLHEQARELARLLVADIALYHQESIDQGILGNDLEERLVEQLTEGREMLARRIPRVELQRQDYLLNALKDFARAREKELLEVRQGSHG